MPHAFDTSVRPQDDFFGYVNNPWLRDNPIPNTETSWGTFYVLRDKSWEAVDGIVKELSSTNETALSHDQNLLKKFFASALSFEHNTSHHLATLRSLIADIDATKPDEIASLLGKLHRQHVSGFWTSYVSQDDKDSSNQVLRFYQSGLSLPNRDYYLERSERMAGYRKAYKTYFGKMKRAVRELGIGEWADIWRVEKKLARISWTDIALRDVQKNYTKLTLQTLYEDCPGFDWGAYFTSLGWDTPSDDLVADQFTFIKASVELLRSESFDAVKSYLKWHVVNSYANWISSETCELFFDFYSRTLSGQKEMKPLWKRAVLLADRLVIGEALGREYAARHFPESSKQAVEGLVEEIRTAYHARIDKLSWMSETTKKRAHTKLDNIKVFVGYPSVWKDLSKLEFDPENIVKNCMQAAAFDTDLDLAKVGKKPAAEEWEMNAHTVNAYNHPNRLEIVFPAAILQTPFYSPKATHAENLGGIGAVIGHEFTHGFDDQGCEFDEHGNTNPWQTPAERKAFDKLAENIVRLGDAFETVPGTHLQGKLILGESIADVGGLTLAVEALPDKSHLKELFINFAMCECGATTPERAVELAKVDPHPPSKFRVNCVVNHNDAFYETYNVTKSDKLYLAPGARAKIW
jgi:predicted metalloendopeptidase